MRVSTTDSSRYKVRASEGPVRILHEVLLELVEACEREGEDRIYSAGKLAISKITEELAIAAEHPDLIKAELDEFFGFTTASGYWLGVEVVARAVIDTLEVFADIYPIALCLGKLLDTMYLRGHNDLANLMLFRLMSLTADMRRGMESIHRAKLIITTLLPIPIIAGEEGLMPYLAQSLEGPTPHVAHQLPLDLIGEVIQEVLTLGPITPVEPVGLVALGLMKGDLAGRMAALPRSLVSQIEEEVFEPLSTTGAIKRLLRAIVGEMGTTEEAPYLARPLAPLLRYLADTFKKNPTLPQFKDAVVARALVYAPDDFDTYGAMAVHPQPQVRQACHLAIFAIVSHGWKGRIQVIPGLFVPLLLSGIDDRDASVVATCLDSLALFESPEILTPLVQLFFRMPRRDAGLRLKILEILMSFAERIPDALAGYFTELRDEQIAYRHRHESQDDRAIRDRLDGMLRLIRARRM